MGGGSDHRGQPPRRLGKTSTIKPMAEIIQLWEFQAARRRAARRNREEQSLERAIAIMRENLAVAAADLCEAPVGAQTELLERIEQLTALIRYGMRMVGDSAGNGDGPGDAGVGSNR
jgi:hypothetical protein